MKNVLFLCMILTIFSGCQETVITGTQGMPNHDNWTKDNQGTSAKRKWTFIIYMAADNDLEAAAIADFNEHASGDKHALFEIGSPDGGLIRPHDQRHRNG